MICFKGIFFLLIKIQTNYSVELSQNVVNYSKLQINL